MAFQGFFATNGRTRAYRRPSLSRVARTVIHRLLLTSLLFSPACSDDSSDAEADGKSGPSAAGDGSTGDDGSNPDAVGNNDNAEVESDVAARFFEPTHLLEINVRMEPQSWDALRVERRTLNDIILGADCQGEPFESPFTWKRATVNVDGITRTDVGIRKKGFLGSLDEQRPSLKIAFDEFRSEDLFGIRDLTLNNVIQDPAVIGQCLGYSVFAKAGLAAPRCNFAHLVVNDQDLGIYAHVEPIKKPFIRRHFAADDGDLYEGTLSDFREGWLGTFDPKTAETDATKAALQPIASAASAPADEVPSRLRAVLDLDTFAKFWAIETLIAHADGYSRNTNNFYVYHARDTGLTAFLPWGADMLFGNGDSSAQGNDPIGLYTQGVIVNALYASAEGRNLLLGALQAALNAVWSESELLAEARRMSSLIRDKLEPSQALRFDAGLGNLQAFVTTRRAALTKAVAAPPEKPQDLRPPACLRAIGTVAGAFSTIWGTAGAADPFAVGTASLDVVLNGSPWTNVAGKVSATVGPSSDPSSEHEIELVIPALRSDGRIGALAFGFDRVDAVAGTLVLDLQRVPGVLFDIDPSFPDTPQVLGIVLGGSLVLDEIGTVTGNAVKGHFSAEIYDTPFLKGF